LKQPVPGAARMGQQVAPLAGAWIETSNNFFTWLGRVVAPLAGAWIETSMAVKVMIVLPVAPLAGAWIETPLRKLVSSLAICRTPRGCVD